MAAACYILHGHMQLASALITLFFAFMYCNNSCVIKNGISCGFITNTSQTCVTYRIAGNFQRVKNLCEHDFEKCSKILQAKC